jgi:molybdopterin/thiamine biosynthesis adenylyltransferase
MPPHRYTLTDIQRERYFSNLAFFTTYGSLDQSAASFQRALADAHVVFLGTGGLGSTVIQALAGAGVSRMTLLDNDTVELRNFARQYLYREEDIGRPKVERAKAVAPGLLLVRRSWPQRVPSLPSAHCGRRCRSHLPDAPRAGPGE